MRLAPVFSLFFGFLIAASQAGAAPKPSPAAAKASPAAAAPGRDPLTVKLQAALSDSLRQIGALEPWQQKVFNEEILPQPTRFIRDFRSQGGGVVVVVDVEGVRGYLKFFAPKFFKKDAPELVVVLRPEPGCDLCTEGLPAIRKLVGDRLERRGLKLIWPKPEQVDLKLTGPGLDELGQRLITQSKTVGVLVVEWKRAAGDEIDTAHADELRFQVRAALSIRDLPKSEGQLEIFDTGSFEKTVGQLMTDFLSEAGTRVDRTPVAEALAEREGFTVEVSGIRGFPHYNQIRTAVMALARDGVAIEEQRLSRGKAVFVVYADQHAEEMRKAFSQLSLPKAEVQVR